MFSIDRFCVSAVLLFCGPAAWSSDAPAKVHSRGAIRVFYETEGKHAVPRGDANGNGVPDRVEDALTQIDAARVLYCEVLGFPDPLRSKRYEGVASLDVFFRSKEALGSNGKAYDEIRDSPHSADPKGTRVVRIGLASELTPADNPTPAHEYFHVIQNGASYFKNRWYTEGAARWSQRPFGNDGPTAARNAETWPLSPEKQTLLEEMSYSAAAYFWKPLAERFDGEGTIPATDATKRLAAMTYVNGDKVWKNERLPGWKLTRSVLKRLDEADDRAFAKRGLEKWSEDEQRSVANNEFIREAIGKVVEEFSKERAGGQPPMPSE